MKLLLSIINWNNSVATSLCLDGIAALNESKQPDIILVDNHSTREKLDIDKALLDRLRSIEIINNKENLGFAGGHNYALQLAIDKSYDFVFLLNNDTELIDPGVFERLAAALDKNVSAIAAAPTILSSLEPEKIWYAGGEINRTLGTAWHHHTLGHQGGTHPVSFLTGTCLAIKVSALKEFGVLLPENYFLYWEDTDWCAQASRAGYSLLYVPGTRILHKVSSSLGVRSSSYAYYIIRNNIFFVRRNISFVFKPIAFVSVVVVSFKYLVKAILNPRAGRGTFRAIRRAWSDGLAGRGGILKGSS